MARAAGGKEAAGWEGEDGQCDSGIESLRSLPGGRETPAAPEGPPAAPEETFAEAAAAEERLDSSYGSGALPEALPGLPGSPGGRPEEPPPRPEGLSRQQLDALTYLSEDGDT